MYGAFRALAPNFWGPFLLSLLRTPFHEATRGLFDVFDVFDVI